MKYSRWNGWNYKMKLLFTKADETRLTKFENNISVWKRMREILIRKRWYKSEDQAILVLLIIIYQKTKSHDCLTSYGWKISCDQLDQFESVGC